MESEAEFVERMVELFKEPMFDDFEPDHASRLFALARRGAGLTLYRQKLFVDRDGSEWVDEYYSRRVSLPPPPKGADDE